MAHEQVGTFVNGTFQIDPEHRQRFIDLVRSHFLGTALATPGCVFYSLSLDIIDDSLFHLVEGWSDRQALDQHLASERLKSMRAELASFTMRNYHTVIYDVRSGSNYVPTDLPIT